MNEYYLTFYFMTILGNNASTVPDSFTTPAYNEVPDFSLMAPNNPKIVTESSEDAVHSLLNHEQDRRKASIKKIIELYDYQQLNSSLWSKFQRMVGKGVTWIIPSANAAVTVTNPTCQRPSFEKASEVYSDVASLLDLTEKVGGRLKWNFDNLIFPNGCASRISYVLNQTGCKISFIQGETSSRENGDWYIYRLTTLRPHLWKVYGPPDCRWRKGVADSPSSPKNSSKCDDLTGRVGLLVEEYHDTTTCTGHAWFGGDTDYPPRDGLFWEFRQTKDKTSLD
ncbi:MAG: T6SS effector amidase Tae4 family protein [Chlamydiota bacterium]